MGLETGAITAIMLGLSAAGAAAGGGVAAAGAAQQRKNAKEQSDALRKAQGVQQQQLVNQQQLERLKIENQAQAIESRLRVLGGESGLAVGGSLTDLANQAEYDRALNVEITRLNLGNSLNALASQSQAAEIQINAQRQNPMLAGLLGAVTGASAGLSLGTSIDSIFRPEPEPVRRANYNSFDEVPHGG